MITLQTERLILRPWQASDLEPFAALNADPKVMEFFPFTLNRKESDALAQRIVNDFEKRGWGFFAVSEKSGTDFIGFIGLTPVESHFPFAPAVEVGWRLAYPFWGRGYAVEGAKAAIHYGFEEQNLREIVSFTAVSNIRSMRVMEKLGMTRNAKDDFEHPRLAAGHPLRPHVLYRIFNSYNSTA